MYALLLFWKRSPLNIFFAKSLKFLHAYMKFDKMPYLKGVSEDFNLHKAYIKPTLSLHGFV